MSVVLDNDGQLIRWQGKDGKLHTVRWKPFQDASRLRPSGTRPNGGSCDRACTLERAGPWKAWPGLWVFDIEAEHRAAGEQWLYQNVSGWRNGVVVETGSKGLHVYLMHSGPVPTDSMIEWGEDSAGGRRSACCHRRSILRPGAPIASWS